MSNFTQSNSYMSTASGNFTTKYLNIFNNYGTTVDYIVYTPKESSTAQNIYAYAASSGSLVCMLDLNGFSQSIGTTLVVDPNTGNSHHEHYGIDNESGEIYLRPTFYLPITTKYVTISQTHNNNVLWHPSYQMTTNGFMRTIMVVKLYDNMYHLINIRPKFIKNQICFFNSQLNLISASYDPFTFIYDETGRLVAGNGHPDPTSGS